MADAAFEILTFCYCQQNENGTCVQNKTTPNEEAGEYGCCFK